MPGGILGVRALAGSFCGASAGCEAGAASAAGALCAIAAVDAAAASAASAMTQAQGLRPVRGNNGWSADATRRPGRRRLTLIVISRSRRETLASSGP